MERKLSYVIVTPYSVAKSRTGGVIARLLSQTDLELVAAQMIAPNENFVHEYAKSIRKQDAQNLNAAGELLAHYIEHHIAPSGGRTHRSLLLIFRGENACRKLSDICGPLYSEDRSIDTLSGETIRDTYADLIVDPEDPKKVVYFEPAILTPRRQTLADENLALFARNLRNSENIIRNKSYSDPTKIEQTLVIIKPDNWNFASSRPGTIIDMFSRTGLRIVGTKIFRFSLNQALDFYGPVEATLKESLAPLFAQKAKEILEKEFAFSLSQQTKKSLGESFGHDYAIEQFQKIVYFMSGQRSDTCQTVDADKPGDVKCMILVYEGKNAIQKIREVLGPTDPLKAPGGTVRREFGSNIMINTAHASDSPESYEREKKIVKIDENPLVSIIDKYFAEQKIPV
jgi:nucleoside diphosphate kinase